MQFNKPWIASFFRSNQKSVLIVFALIISQSIYFSASAIRYDIGFPLDDAWIHQTYARNFAHSFRWEYIPGMVSGGSTSPLWTLLLSPGYLIGQEFYLIWTYFLSTVFFAGSAIIFEKILSLNKTYHPRIPIAGLLFCLEWHFVWVACSGMETILFIFVILLFCYFILQTPPSYIKAMICVALILWIRPDGITLVGPWILLVIISFFKNENNLKALILSLTFLVVSIILYALFNYLVTGTFLPNTFYAKQAEYAVFFQSPIVSRYINLFVIPITGVGVLLIPGFIQQLVVLIRRKEFNYIGLIFWFFGYILIYAIRLPVVYQHGRYIIPAIPIFLLLGIKGFFDLQKIKSQKFLKPIIKAWQISSIFTLFIFLLLGMDSYATDVAIIESEMVNTAKWINLNTNPDLKVGAHDIGALGFFGNREIIDLAGLITPDVIPFIRDEEKLAMYLDEKNVDLLMTFPDWYPKLTRGKKIIYTTGSVFSPKSGGENMVVYNWRD